MTHTVTIPDHVLSAFSRQSIRLVDVILFALFFWNYIKVLVMGTFWHLPSLESGAFHFIIQKLSKTFIPHSDTEMIAWQSLWTIPICLPHIWTCYKVWQLGEANDPTKHDDSKFQVVHQYPSLMYDMYVSELIRHVSYIRIKQISILKNNDHYGNCLAIFMCALKLIPDIFE